MPGVSVSRAWCFRRHGLHHRQVWAGFTGPARELIGTLYITAALFVFVILGAIARMAGFGILRFFWFLRGEIILVLATSSCEPALPNLMAKLEKLGCSKTLVGLVVPTGYTFNANGTSLYMTLAALFVAQATNTHLTILQQFTILGVALLKVPTAPGAGTSFWVPQLNRFYVAAPGLEKQEAAILNGVYYA